MKWTVAQKAMAAIAVAALIVQITLFVVWSIS